MAPPRFDVAIVGAGMAGASAAYFLARDRSVVILEGEAQPGYHTTGRSAALYTQAYGNAPIRALTVASKPFFDAPPEGFADAPLLTPRGALVIARKDQRETLLREAAEAQRLAPRVRVIDAEEACALSPSLRPDYVAAGSFEPDAMDMDVNAILQGFLRGARRHGAELWTDAAVTDMAEKNAGWRLETARGPVDAEIVVNAAGAWAETLAAMAGAARIRITPKRRTAFLFRPPTPAVPGLDAAPMTIDVDEKFYFKPDAGLILGSPADETPTVAQDAQPEEWDVAVGVERIQAAADLPVRRIEKSWAGLRSFADDKTPVLGFDEDRPGFFWLAGQGGYGIQTAPAMGALARSEIAGEPMADALAAVGFDPALLAPGRFAT